VRRFATVGAGLLLVACVACEGGERREAGSVVVAVQRFHQADNAGKPAAAEALRAVPCSAADVCQTRDLCLVAADSWAKAVILKDTVGRAIDLIEKGILAKDAPEAQALPDKLENAERLLKEGHARLAECDDAVAALKRKHRL
jgi:hypothetical protein